MKLRATALPLSALLLMLSAVWMTAFGASFSEPPLVVHGKVVKLGQGGGLQLFSGTLHVKLVNQLNPSHVLDFDIPLRKAGANGEFSYRVEIDQATQPAADEMATTLVVGTGEILYTIQSVTVNGYPASLLDCEQAAEFSTSFASRGEELRLDFRTDLPTPDTDGDGIPDWWEQLYGLDPANSADALVDTDGDGWNNLKEFQLSTDPLTGNQTPVLQNSLLVVTAGGCNGVYLSIADADTPPEQLKLTLLESGTGLVWKRAGSGLATGASFTYADLLAGNISVDVASSFTKNTVRLRLEDLSTAGVAPQEVAVVLEAFAPNRRWLANPVVWLDAGSVTQGVPLEEWVDRSAYRRDGYQPYALSRPVADGFGRLRFHDSQYLYVDDKELTLGQSVALLTFELDAETLCDQTLFSSSELEISIGGPDSGIHGRSIKVVQEGRTIHGPVVDVHRPLQLTLESTANSAVLRIPGMGSFQTRVGEDAPLSSFTTVGARHPFSADAAENFFNGSLREVLIYNRPVNPETRAFLEDYQLARWQGVRVWNQRGTSQPVQISGAGGVRNSICGGECDDTLAGAEPADILRGGIGNNRLTGKAGADLFVLAKTGGKDVITDFSSTAGDVIDLTELFAGKTGLPSQYIKIKNLTVRDANNVPRVDTRLELVYGGVGTTPDQTITLEGVGFGSSDLARMVGEGRILLGGPRYDSVITLAVSAENPSSPGSPRKLTVSRSGSTAAAIQVPLSLGGTARVDADYQIVGSLGTGSVRSVPLARGATQAVFDLVPAQTRSGLNTTLAVTALPVPQVSDGGASLSLTLQGVSTLAIRTVSHIHSDLGRDGLIEIVRSGGTEQALDVPLALSGSLVSGVNFLPLPTTVHFASGQTSSQIKVSPIGNSAPAGDSLPSLQVALASSPLQYSLGSPAVTTVLWVSQGGGDTSLSYSSWEKIQLQEYAGSDWHLLDPDLDGVPNILEYLAGSNPMLADGSSINLRISAAVDGFDVSWDCVRALTDVSVDMEESNDLIHWTNSAITLSEKLLQLPDGRIRHTCHFSNVPGTRSRYFRLRPELLSPLPQP